ncbi:restriction endonuclease subunit S [Pseudomonas syringae]|uniref:restriction endonuclease subunit S n=1 Tax=Pseudomonas syringae TaxID=317 RepID=UPI0032047F46
MRIVPLGEVCKVVSGSTPKREKAEYWGGIIPWVTPKEINRLASPYLWDSAQKITEEGFNSCSTSMLPAGSVLLSSRAPIGLLAINKIPVCTNQGFKSLVPSSEVNSEYLYYILKANVKVLQARGNGATFKELAKPAVEDFEIPLPPLEDQIRIAHLLGKVEGLTAQRKKHLQQLDDLLKSVFLEMFGDPVRNERGWDTHQFSDLLDDIESGKSPKCEAREATAEEWGVLKLGAVTRCRFDEQENM